MYKVQKLAEIANVSVRTLHHYDEIGLLKPSLRTETGYRLYGESELLRLQQILFFRELDFPLKEIQQILDKPDFDTLESLRYHKKMLEQKSGRIAQLLATIDKTIEKISEEKTMKNEEELFEGFSKKQYEEYTAEARERWDPKLVDESVRKVKSYSKEKLKEIKDQGEEITRKISEQMDKDPGHPEVQNLIAQHYQHLHNFYTPNLEMYRGLGNLYVEDPRFTAYYDKYRPGLAQFVQKAITYFCDNKQ